MSILVTGCNGFIGQALLEQLEAKNIAHRAAFRHLAGLSPEQKEHAVAIGSIDGSTDWSGALHGISSVIHLAARTHIMRDEAPEPLTEYRKVNTEGTLNLARQAANAGVRRFIFLSSVKVYGESTTSLAPFSETSPFSTEDAYGGSKKEAEDGLKSLSVETGMEVVIIQPPLVYGSGVKANFLSLIKLADSPVPLPFHAIQNQRSMIYLGNLVDFIIVCLNHSAAGNQTFLVSDGEDMSLPQLLVSIRKSLDRPVRLFSFPSLLFRMVGTLTSKADVVDRLVGDLRVNSSKATNLTGWVPPYTVEQGIRTTVTAYTKGK